MGPAHIGTNGGSTAPDAGVYTVSSPYQLLNEANAGTGKITVK